MEEPLIFEVEAGSVYNDPGIKELEDDFDSDVDLQLSGDPVDIQTLGEYTVVYTATDNAGNKP